MKISLGRTEVYMNEILKAERSTKTYGKSIAVSEVSLTVRQVNSAQHFYEKNGFVRKGISRSF